MSDIPAYPIQSSAMRPVTKITIVGIRLGVVALAAYWIVIFFGTHIPASGHESPDLISDKVKHYGAFFGLGLMMCYVTTSTRLWRRFLAIAGAGMLYAAVDEVTQYFSPGRVPDFLDFLADSAGLLSAISIYLVARYYFRRVVCPS